MTDAFLRGDVFNVYDFGALIGTTSAVAASGSCGDDPMPCLADPLASSGVFALAKGAHSLEIKAAVSPYNAGAAYFRVDVIPEPGAALLFGVGLLVVGRALRRSACSRPRLQ